MDISKILKLSVIAVVLAALAPTAGDTLGCFGRASAQTAYLCAGCGCPWRKDEPECVEERRRANMTPEQLKAADAERERQLAEKRRREAAEAERLAAEKARKVEALSEALGGREAAAKRLQPLDEEAAKYRPKAPAAICTTKTVAKPFSVTRANQVEAVAAIDREQKSACGNGGRYLYANSPRCKSLPPVALPRPPVGDCLACISEKMAKNLYNWDPVSGYPPLPPDQWSCEVTVQCEVRRCTGNSSASKQ